MKRVVIKVTRHESGWDGVVNVDGEFFAGSTSRSYVDVVQQCAHYATGLVTELEEEER